jgi:glycine cleavage system H protein
MSQFLETTVDKFTFRVADDRFYTPEGIWALPDGNQIWVGISDYLQQRSGDVAFADTQPVGKQLAVGEEAASIETIKVTFSLGSPVSGTLVQVNPSMTDTPEVINLDPYGDGWIAVIEAEDWEADKTHLLDPQAYFEHMKSQAEAEARS